MKKIAIVGCTGRTGRMVASQWLEIAGGNKEIRLVLAGRDKIMLERMSTNLGQKYRVPVDIAPFNFSDRGGLRQICEGSDVVINCVGPYTTLGAQVFACAVQGKAHYLDACSEPAFFEQCALRDAGARENNVAVINGLNAQAGLADLTASVAAQGWQPVMTAHVVHIALDVDPGLAERQAYLTLLGEPPRAYIERRLQTIPLHSVKRTFKWDGGQAHGLVFTGGEIFLLPRSLAGVRDVYVYEHATGLKATLGNLVASVTPTITRLLKKSWASQGSEATHDNSRAVCAVELTGNPGKRLAVVAAPGLYSATAKLLCHAAMQLLKEGPRKVGVISPSQAVDAFTLLKAAGLEVQIADQE